MAFAIPTWPLGIWGGALPQSPVWSGKVCEDLAMIGTEWVDFVSRRLKEDLNLLPRLAACKCTEDAFGVYATFWRKLGDDYSREFAALNKLVSEFAVSASTRSPR
jgi:hypothetical protein